VSGIFFIPTFFRMIRSLLNEETLLIISLAFCFLMVALATYVGFSSALGAFIMGSILAETTKAEKIEQLTKSIKTLFGAIFFVSVGMLIDPQMLVKHIVPIFAATLVLMFGKPLFVMLGVLISGQPLKIAVQSGMSLSQIGEFSFIIATLGLSLNVTSDFLYPVAVAVSVLTTFTTPYMIRFSEPVYKKLEIMLPQKWKNTLDAYNIGANQITEISDWEKVLKSYFLNLVIFSVIIISLIILSTRYLEPIFLSYGGHKLITAMITLAVLSPFLWALSFRRTQRKAYANVWLKSTKRGPLILLQFSGIVLAVLFIGFLFYHFFSPVITFWGILITCVILTLFLKKIQTFYGKIETSFLANFNERESGTMNLTPWDTHITKFELNALSPYIGKTLSESKIREEFGINIVVIERGDFVITIPNRDHHLYPNDKISVIGTDEQLDHFKTFLESSVNKYDTENERQNVSIHHFTLNKNSSLTGKTLRKSKIHERSKGLVVGIERNGERILNPESDFIFETGDIVWIAGNKKCIQVIFKE